MKDGDAEQNRTESKPEAHHDGQGTDETPDRAQPELTEQNLLTEKRSETDDPKEREALEGELESMQEEIQEANEN